MNQMVPDVLPKSEMLWFQKTLHRRSQELSLGWSVQDHTLSPRLVRDFSKTEPRIERAIPIHLTGKHERLFASQSASLLAASFKQHEWSNQEKWNKSICKQYWGGGKSVCYYSYPTSHPMKDLWSLTGSMRGLNSLLWRQQHFLHKGLVLRTILRNSTREGLHKKVQVVAGSRSGCS